MIKARENPFRSERIEGLRFRCPGTSVGELAERAIGMGACAIVGPEGSGKTTLLEALSTELEGRGFEVRLRRLGPGGEAGGPAESPPGARKAALLLDGLESGGARVRPLLREMAARGDLLVVSAHRTGLLPTLVELRTSARLLGDLVLELVGEDEFPRLELGLPHLFEKHRGNLRACFRELYDRFSQAPHA